MPPFYATTSRLALNRINLPATVVHQVVVALHNLFELLRIVRTLAHRQERFETRHFHFGYNGPVALGANVRHDSHFSHASFLAELCHRKELLDHRAYLSRLAIHDVANE